MHLKIQVLGLTCQVPGPRYQVAGRSYQVTVCMSKIADLRLQVLGLCRSQILGRRSQISGCTYRFQSRSQVTGLRFSGSRSQCLGPRLQVACHRS